MVELETDIKNCIKVLQEGGVILYPTETVWGLGCDAMNPVAVEKIFAIKQRPKEKSLIILLAEAKDIFQYVATPPPDIVDMLENFEKPTTVIYEHALGFPENVIHQDGSIAIRITSDPLCKAIIKRFKKPIVSTSANISGMTITGTFQDIPMEIKTGVGYIVKYRQDEITIHPPSRLIRLDEEGNIEILRP